MPFLKKDHHPNSFFMRKFPSPDVVDETLLLRPIELSDVNAWFAYLSLPYVVQHTSWNVKSPEDLRSLIASYNSEDPESPMQFAIVDKASGVFAGVIGFHAISVVNRTAEISYNLHPDYWGRGIITACCRALVRWGLTEGGFVRIQATALDTNLASARILQKCGFEVEGKLRKLKIVRGESRDFWLYAITNANLDDIDSL